MNNIGFIVDIYTRDGKTYVMLVLNHHELKSDALRLGEFVNISTGDYSQMRASYLGMVTNSVYRPVTYKGHVEALALHKLNQERSPLDEHALKNINFLHYEIVILGRYTKEGNLISFHPSTRMVPSLVDVSVSRIEDCELQDLVNVSLQPAEAQSNEPPLVDFGYLRIGSDKDGERQRVRKRIDVANFHGRRTANFGKTGFGKSNENKVILLLLKRYFPKMGMLIFDLNGEYATQTTESTAKGLIQAFEELGILNQIVWFTNRQVDSGLFSGGVFEAKPIKINFFKEPYLAIELAYQRDLFQGGRPPQYLEAARAGLDPQIGDWRASPNRMAYVYGALLEAGLTPHQFSVQYGNQSYTLPDQKGDLVNELRNSEAKPRSSTDSEGGARDLFRFSKRLSFLRDLHTHKASEDFFEAAVNYCIGGKVVIVDLPTVRPEQVEFISSRLAAHLFNKALQRYAQGAMGEQQTTDVLVVIEEAHNLLSNPDSIFYRIAREGRKYGIGMLYSTQSPSAIPIDILAQTENFLVKHLSSEEDVKALKKAKVAFAEPISDFILNEPVVGLSYVYMEPYQPFPVPVQVRLLEDVISELKQQ